MNKPYEREFTVTSFRGVTLVRVTERPMLDPLFDTDPIAKIEILDDEQGWIDWTGKLSLKQEQWVLDQWQRAYDEDFCESEATLPMF